MSHIRMLILSSFAALAAMLALGRLPAAEPRVQELREAAAVSVPEGGMTISDDNLADAVASLRLNHRITKVGWDHSILTIDLTLRNGVRGDDSLWSDMAGLLRFAFGETGNVHRTLIRVYLETNGRKTLLFYGAPSRDEWTGKRLERLERLARPQAGAEAAFAGAAGLSVTPAGERWIRNIAN
ncbi:hypothetical protein GE107_11280 [Cohnella sp. CFH 77786]|uniref:hypothetical protein n=1 Tax=Cohnella sp. CFH 77786 TaxID=2662265 RepID=UPI001C60F4BF|nr:hypothetical protein [Cohnella sp. CFH 77786]MBW5446643.1 hypothetical protein [Cohnella sp. CFH 77786]